MNIYIAWNSHSLHYIEGKGLLYLVEPAGSDLFRRRYERDDD